MLKQLLNRASEDIEYELACWKYRLAGNKEPQTKALVNGSPRSGTTWMLRMIASIPGYFSVGNFQRDLQRYHTVRPGAVVHGHDTYTPELQAILQEEGIRVVLMVRDPRDQLVSRMFHVKRSQNHAWHDQMKDMNNDEALLLCIEGREGLPGMDVMIRLAQSWLDNDAAMIGLKYEELLADPIAQFGRILTYLGIHDTGNLAKVIVDRNRFKRASAGRKIWAAGRKPGQEKTGSHFRKGITGDWKNYLNAEHIAKFKEVAGQQLIALGYEQDLDW